MSQKTIRVTLEAPFSFAPVLLICICLAACAETRSAHSVAYEGFDYSAAGAPLELSGGRG
jgi:hypothetical protein